MPRYALPLAVLALCAFAAPSRAQFDKTDPFPKDPFGTPTSKLPKKFAALADVKVEVVPAAAKWGETVKVRLTVQLKEGAGGYTYPIFPKDPKQPGRNSVELLPPGDLIFISKPTDPAEPKLKEKPREGSANGEMDQYYDKSVSWELKAVVSPRAKPGKVTVAFGADTSIQVCKEVCIIASGDQLPTATFEVLEGASERVNPEDLAAALDVLKVSKPAVPPDRGGQVLGGPPTPSTGTANNSGSRKQAKPTDAYTEDLKAIATSIVPAEACSDTGGGKPQSGLWGFILTAAAWGLISLVTPCVFPMIPITVSIFLKQAHGSFRERFKLAGVYSLTIITVLGVSAFALLKFMAWLSAHPVTNVLLAVLFLVLALSLFGMYELTLPNSLAKRLQARQSKGGTVGTIFGALAFTVISFTCVAPFLGGFAGISAGSSGDSGGLVVMPTAKEIAGGLAFATAFAAPFFVLALVPGLMKALPKSGGWLDSVKVVMGFLELAAALKFLRTAELRVFPTPQYFTYDIVLGGWVAISIACGLYLLNVYRLPHDEERPNIGVPRLLFALMFLGLGLYLMPALFKGADGKPQRPAGAVYAWIEAFLLPEATEDGWRTDLKDTIEAAKKSGKPIFVDFTGVTCTNCKYNEHNVFPQKTVAEQLQQFERVQLYTDEVPAAAYSTDPGREVRQAEAKANRDFQNVAFKDVALPLYAVLMPQPDGKLKVIGVYPEGKINEPERFAKFLKDSLEKAKPKK